MANFAITDVTYSIISRSRDARGKRVNIVKLTFGDGALTYATGGIPLDKGKMGVPNVIEALIPFDSLAASLGYGFQYEKATEKLVILQAPAQSHNHDILLKNAAVADGATTRINAGANLLGANTGGDLTVTGGGANGGIVTKTLAASALVEPNTVAIAAQSIHVQVIGW